MLMQERNQASRTTERHNRLYKATQMNSSTSHRISIETSVLVCFRTPSVGNILKLREFRFELRIFC